MTEACKTPDVANRSDEQRRNFVDGFEFRGLWQAFISGPYYLSTECQAQGQGSDQPGH